MILQLHPTGNTFVRASLRSLDEAGLLAVFATTVGFPQPARWQSHFPLSIANELGRRNYAVRRDQLLIRPLGELLRLTAVKLKWKRWIRGEDGRFSIDAVAEDFTQHLARKLPRLAADRKLSGVYAYDHAALEVFQAAKKIGLATIFELPIAYWSSAVRLLREEAERWPEWKPTLEGILNSPAKQERKTQELELADTIICPSQFVLDSIPAELREARRCVLAPFGTPTLAPAGETYSRPRSGRLRVLFAGILSQRKGLADAFAALRLANRGDIELVVLGRLVAPMSFYRREYSAFTYEPPRPHAEVLQLMQTCDVLLFPSVVEGRALVQQEAMACGLPIIVTPNAGGEDLIVEGRTGFLVPIRRPDIIAERLTWCADNRDTVVAMGQAARVHAMTVTWEAYGQNVVRAVRETLSVKTRGAEATASILAEVARRK